MNADPGRIGADRLSSADASRLLALTEGRVRQLARQGKLGAVKDGRDWTFSRREVEERVARSGGPLDVVGEDLAAAQVENESLRFERQLLLAQSASQEHALRVARLEADVDERDATIAVLNARVAQLERQLAASVTAVSELASSLLDTDQSL